MTVREAMAERAEKRKAASIKAKQEAMAAARSLKPEQPFDEAAAQAEFDALDSLALTVWMIGCRKEPSGHVGGGMMLNADWLKAEQARFARSNVKVEIAENPLKRGEFALVRSA